MADNHVAVQNQNLANVLTIARDPFFLLIEEMIDYSLRHHNVHGWNLPVRLEDARSMNDLIYFNEDFARTVVSPETESQAVYVAESLYFQEAQWLRFTDHEEAVSYVEYYLLGIYQYHERNLYEMFAFGCYAIRIAIQVNQHPIANTVVWALLSALYLIYAPEEYYRRAFEHNNLFNPPNDADEGLGGIRDADDIHFVTERRLFWVHTDPILLFVEELIDFSLRRSGLPGRFSAIDFEIIEGAGNRYFTENLGRAINHFFISNEAMAAAEEHGFEEETWVNFRGLFEARNFQHFFLRQVFDFGRHPSILRMLSFASYSSRLAMRRNREDLVNEVVSALAHAMCNYYSFPQQYIVIDANAWNYNHFHHNIPPQSDDEGIVDDLDEVANAHMFEDEAAAQPEPEGGRD